MNALNAVVTGSTWGPGSTWMNGVRDWGPIAAVVPRAAGRTSPGDHLITFAAYGIAPGALVWASVSPNTNVNDPLVAVKMIVDLGMATAFSAELIKEYAYANKAISTLKFMARMNVTAAASAEVGTGFAVGTLDSGLSDGAL